LCPFHEEKTPSFQIDPERQLFYCFGCQSGGDVFRFVEKLEHKSFSEALQFLGDRAGIPPPDRAGSSEVADRRKVCLGLYRDFETQYRKSLLSPDGGPAREYLFEKRQISQKTVERFGLGFSPPGSFPLLRESSSERLKEMEFFGLIRPMRGGGFRDFMNGRLIIPIRTENGATVAFGGRILADGAGPKYMNSPEHAFYRKKDVLFGLDQAMNSLGKTRRAVVVEGYFDVIVLSECGLTNVVAPLGTALTSSHLIQLSRMVDEVVLMFDGDRAGRSAMTRLLEKTVFDSRISVRAVGIPDGLDPDEWIRRDGLNAVTERISSSPLLSTYVVEQMKQSLDLSGEGREELLSAFETLVRRVPDPLEQDHLLSMGAGIFGIDKSLLALRILQGSERKPISTAGPDMKSRTTNGELKELNLLVELFRLWGDGCLPHPSEVLSLGDFSFLERKDYLDILGSLWENTQAAPLEIQQLISVSPPLVSAWMALPPGTEGRDERLGDLVGMVRRLGLHARKSGGRSLRLL
jgi:DNA primase